MDSYFCSSFPLQPSSTFATSNKDRRRRNVVWRCIAPKLSAAWSCSGRTMSCAMNFISCGFKPAPRRACRCRMSTCTIILQVARQAALTAPRRPTLVRPCPFPDHPLPCRVFNTLPDDCLSSHIRKKLPKKRRKTPKTPKKNTVLFFVFFLCYVEE